jgi:hypothetical protein
MFIGSQGRTPAGLIMEHLENAMGWATAISNVEIVDPEAESTALILQHLEGLWGVLHSLAPAAEKDQLTAEKTENVEHVIASLPPDIGSDLAQLKSNLANALKDAQNWLNVPGVRESIKNHGLDSGVREANARAYDAVIRQRTTHLDIFSPGLTSLQERVAYLSWPQMLKANSTAPDQPRTGTSADLTVLGQNSTVSTDWSIISAKQNRSS